MNQIDIFYADDDDDDLMLISEAVEKISVGSEYQINLHIHRNGENLIQNIKNNHDTNGFVLLDINMPFKSGFELLSEIRNEDVIKRFPVIMYSTSSNRDNIDMSQGLGADLYVIKPYDYHNLLKMLTAFIHIDWKNYQTDIDNFLYRF
ncbi:MAG: response regulator [Flavobacterium sp.]